MKNVDAIRETFLKMEHGVEYVLSDEMFNKLNILRKENEYTPYKHKDDYTLVRKNEDGMDKLLINNIFVFDFNNRTDKEVKEKFSFPRYFKMINLEPAKFINVPAVHCLGTPMFLFGDAFENNGLEKF